MSSSCRRAAPRRAAASSVQATFSSRWTGGPCQLYIYITPPSHPGTNRTHISPSPRTNRTHISPSPRTNRTHIFPRSEEGPSDRPPRRVRGAGGCTGSLRSGSCQKSLGHSGLRSCPPLPFPYGLPTHRFSCCSHDFTRRCAEQVELVFKRWLPHEAVYTVGFLLLCIWKPSHVRSLVVEGVRLVRGEGRGVST